MVGGQNYLLITKAEEHHHLFSQFLFIVVDVLQATQLLLLPHLVYVAIVQHKLLCRCSLIQHVQLHDDYIVADGFQRIEPDLGIHGRF